MSYNYALNYPVARTADATLRFLQNALMLLGALFVLVSAYAYVGKPDLNRLFGVVAPANAVAAEANAEDEASEAASADGKLSPRMQAALHYSAKRYRVAPQALVPIFEAAQQNANELGLDPLLIVSVIAVESNFNPMSESVMGAQGLMQVIPRYHKEKLPSDAGEAPLLDPAINVAVGSRVLDEYIRRRGGVVGGLLQFNGSSNDPSKAYANKVLAVKERMESASRRSGTSV